MSKFETALRETVNKTNALATMRLRQQAISQGWDRGTASSVSVDITTSEQIVMGEAAQDLEYGGLSQAPNAAVRNFDQAEIGNAFNAALRAEMAKIGLVI